VSLRAFSNFSVALTLAFQLGCATYQVKVKESRDLISKGEAARAVELLEPLAQKEGDDQLVYMLDYAVALQQAGRYQESARILNQADRISEIQDYTSLSREATSLLLSEGFVQYKGDDYEKILINAVNAINFIMLGNLESALVEIRRLNNKLNLYRTEGKRDYELNPFAYYLGGVLWEADNRVDEAYISYKKAYELIPDYAPLREDLIRAGIRAQRPDEVDGWKKKFPDVKLRPEWRDPNMGELVVIYQQGWGPRKHPHPDFPRIPKLYPVRSLTTQAQVTIEPTTGVSVASSSMNLKTEMVYDVSGASIRTLDAQYAPLIAKRVAGIAAKAVVSDQLRQKNQLIGDLTWIALNIADRADLRQWSTLPESFQIARGFLKSGRYKVQIKGLSAAGTDSGESHEWGDVEIKPKKKTFLVWRSFR